MPIFFFSTGALFTILSWNAFIPLSRLTYGIYLVHLLIHLLRMANAKTAINVDEFLMVTFHLKKHFFRYYFLRSGLRNCK